MPEPKSLADAIKNLNIEREQPKGKSYSSIQQVEEEFKHIELTEQERVMGLLHAYGIAAERLEKERKERNKQAQIAEAKRLWSYEELRLIAFERGRVIGQQEGFEFVLDDFNEHVFHLLCLYFTNDPAFEEEVNGAGVPYSLNKGIWLQSPLRGTGKTVLLRLSEYGRDENANSSWTQTRFLYQMQ
jgi:exoribonuclease R